MVAIGGALLDQVPPPVASARVVVAPTHNTAVPVIGATLLTVNVTAAEHPAAVI